MSEPETSGSEAAASADVEAASATASATENAVSPAGAPARRGLHPRIKKLLMIMLPLMMLSTVGALLFVRNHAAKKQAMEEQAMTDAAKNANVDAVVAMLADSPVKIGDTKSVAAVQAAAGAAAEKLTPPAAAPASPSAVEPAKIEAVKPAAVPGGVQVAAAAPPAITQQAGTRQAGSKAEQPAAAPAVPEIPLAPAKVVTAKPPSFVVMRGNKEVLHDFTRAPVE